jgi:protein tyrosine/serine phosphatase
MPEPRTLLQPRNDIPGVSNFAQISPVLYRGAQPTPEGFKQLKKMGIKTVVNLRTFHTDRRKLKGAGLRFAHLYCKAWHPESEDVARFLKLMEDKKNHPVFVHCLHGADRTGMMVAAYRIIEQGWNVDDAARETHNFGFHKIFKMIQHYLQRFDSEAIKKAVVDAKPLKVKET